MTVTSLPDFISAAENLKAFIRCGTVYIDGTFNKCCTNMFCQLHAIHGLINGHCTLTSFSVLKDMETISYRNVFSAVVGECHELNLKFQLTRTFSDFEKL